MSGLFPAEIGTPLKTRTTQADPYPSDSVCRGVADDDSGRFEVLTSLLDDFESGALDARELINRVDDLVGDDMIANWPLDMQQAVERLQDELACCVFDELSVAEAPNVLFLVSELPERVRKFRTTLIRNG